MRRLPPLGALRAFEAAARRLSFKDAAAELGVTPTAVSHQIRQLEEGLGVALFERAPRRVGLTAVGEALYPALRRAFDDMDEAVAAARRRPTRRVATLTATVAFTAKLLVPKAARFREMHPEWDLRLHASDAAVDLSAGEADAAIRYGLGPRPGLASAPLMIDAFAPVACPRMAPRSPAELAMAPLIHFDWGASGATSVPTWRSWGEAAGLRGVDWEAGVAFNDEASVIQAAVAGQGVALLSLALVAAELASGLLTQPFGPVLPGWRYDFVCPEGAENRPAVAALRCWIEEEVLSGARFDDAGTGRRRPGVPADDPDPAHAPRVDSRRSI
ncbi:LysR family glycine cleavage system transcriptional activator [Methylopila capsulata]|uniref:LysR family glycine cleavage system transcriptional activator n=1 Tax=Methylopila capsulata TaxID=61654 RepID=A0A9W6IWE4_9HYPH|nr:LysR substrate-binding domain-containing protein [Methylopila capsulata]MBM7852331.1 LysR family glycine cleavage system transcriptional activator [Methylopila capsulata]GLK56540.1 LysR family transcriptional regulator [Methylopila capsulata]